MKKDTWVYDIETLIGLFTVTFLNIITKESISFAVGKGIDQRGEMLNFYIDRVQAVIGFNNLHFDSPIFYAMLLDYNRNSTGSPGDAAYGAYELAQKIITSEERLKLESLPIPELDLFLLHHFNNPARATSLKWLQCYYNIDNIQEMPYNHDVYLPGPHAIKQVLGYNSNDCEATLLLYNDKKTKELIEVRNWARVQYHRKDVINMSNSSMGEMIFKEMLLKAGDIQKPYPVRPFKLKEIILPIVNFKTPKFQKIFEKIQNFKITGEEDQTMKFTLIDDGLEYLFGLGGIHAARERAEFQNVESVDVVSYYPRLAIVNQFYPRHLSQKVFVETYNTIFNQRVSTKKGSPANLALKETLNSAFGKSNSKYSFLFDPQFLYSITINGQLLLAMLCERISMTCGRIIMANTDGIEVQVSDPVKFKELTDKWQKLTGLQLEASTYKKIMIRDVNNYIALTTDGKLKTKGAYEYEKDFHKDQSMKIAAMTVARWFEGKIDKIDIPNYIKSYIDMKPFFMFARAKTGEFVGIAPDGKKIELQRTIRYLATSGGYILNRKSGKKLTKIHKDTHVSIVNQLNTGDPTNEELRELIHFNWYIRETMKLIMEPVPTLSF